IYPELFELAMKRRLFLWGGAGCLLLAFSMIVSLSLGTANIPIAEVWSIVLHSVTGWGAEPISSQAYEQIVLQVRFPRVVLAILVGASLSLAGAAFQGVLRNPLADSYTLGVASGASFGAAFLISFGWHYVIGQWTVPIAAFITALLSLFIVM